MKRILSVKNLIIVLLAVVMLFSCDRNGDDEPQKATSGNFTINLWFSDEVLAIFDVSAVFTDYAGNVVTEVVTTENTVTGVTTTNMDLLEEGSPLPEELNCFTKEFKNQKFPTSLSYQLVYALKDNVDDSYFYDENGISKCDIAYCYEQKCVNNFSQPLINNLFSRVIIGLERNNIDRWSEIQSKIYHKMEIDADGIVILNE